MVQAGVSTPLTSCFWSDEWADPCAPLNESVDPLPRRPATFAAATALPSSDLVSESLLKFWQLELFWSDPVLTTPIPFHVTSSVSGSGTVEPGGPPQLGVAEINLVCSAAVCKSLPTLKSDVGTTKHAPPNEVLVVT